MNRQNPKAAPWLSIILHLWGSKIPSPLTPLSSSQSSQLPCCFRLPVPSVWKMPFLPLSSHGRHCPFHPSDASLQPPLTGLLALLQTVPLFFKLSSIIPTGEISLKGQPKGHRFLHESSKICPVRHGLFLFWHHTTKIYLSLCTWRRYIPDIYIMSSVLRRNLSNVINFPIHLDNISTPQVNMPKENSCFFHLRPVNPPAFPIL